VSRATEAPSAAQLEDLTFATLTEEHKRESRASWGMSEVAWSGLTLLLILVAYLYFNG
jgi:SSS family solute:Na+ symporter